MKRTHSKSLLIATENQIAKVNRDKSKDYTVRPTLGTAGCGLDVMLDMKHERSPRTHT